MKTSIDAVSSVEKKITVEIPAEEVDKRIEEQFAEIRREVPLKGFRRGKAPIEMVRRLFRESVEKDLSDRIVRETLADVVKEKDIKILSLGKVDAGKVSSGEGFTFSVDVEVVPEVEAKDYKGIPVRMGKEKVKDEDVEAAIERLRTPFARFQPEEGRKAQRGDLAEFSFSAVSDGETVDENEKTSIVLINGIPFGQEFEDNMMGVGAGDERSFRIAYPATYPHSKYAGKTVDFKVKVFTVRERRLPALDDEFARQFGAPGGLEDLRARMREKLEREAESKSRHSAEEEIRRKLAERNPIEVPPTLVKRQTMAMIGSTIEHMESSGVNLKKARLDFDEMHERLKFSAEHNVRVGLLIEAISRQENFDVPYSEIEAEMKGIAETEGRPFEEIREKYSSEEKMDSLRDRLMERKVMNFLLENAEVKEEVAE
jgi:trigger factor